jgi:hypothetical protein
LSPFCCIVPPTPTPWPSPTHAQTLSVLPTEWVALPKLRVKCRIQNFAPAIPRFLETCRLLSPRLHSPEVPSCCYEHQLQLVSSRHLESEIPKSTNSLQVAIHSLLKLCIEAIC